jgi:hypothetical protein
MVTLGYNLGGVQFVRANFEKVVLLIIALSLLPVALQLLKRNKRAPEPEAEPSA